MAIDHDSIRNAFLGLGLVGDQKSGILRRFGVILAANTSDFLVGREFDLIDNMGGEPSRKLTERVLTDAAQWCANSTFQGIMDSSEWKTLIEPNIKNIQDRLSGLVAITNCLGWGKIIDWNLAEEKKTLILSVRYSYYVDAYKRRYGENSTFPICFMWTGVAAGYLDLLFGSSPNTFTAIESNCSAMGGDLCTFEAKLAKTKFGFN